MTAFKTLGTYGNGVGVVTPLDHKLAQAGQVVKTGINTIRTGLFWGGTATIVSGTAGMSYSVAAYECAMQRSAAAGATFGGNDGTLSVATTAAPGSNSRIDIIYHWPREYSIDGVDSNPVIGVVQGTAAAIPTAPSLAAFPGAIEIGRATVGAGITATTSATITQTALFTAMAGGVVPVRNTTERDAGTWLESQVIWLIDQDTLQVYTGVAWGPVAVTPAGVPITITSAVATGGTGTINADGSATFTGANTAFRVNALLATLALYRKVDAIVTIDGNNDNVVVNTQVCLAGTADATASAYTSVGDIITGTTATVLTTTATSWGQGYSGARRFRRQTWQFFGLAIAAVTDYMLTSVERQTTGSRIRVDVGGTHDNTVAYDGLLFTITGSSSTCTATVRLIGYP